MPLIAAVALGDSTALVVSLLGLGALLATSALWFTVVKWVGGLYLLCLGIKLLRAGLQRLPPWSGLARMSGATWVHDELDFQRPSFHNPRARLRSGCSGCALGLALWGPA